MVGPGGVGKTRLALRLAETMVRSYPDGVRLVKIGALADPGLVPHAVAAALGLIDRPGAAVTEQLVGIFCAPCVTDIRGPS